MFVQKIKVTCQCHDCFLLFGRQPVPRRVLLRNPRYSKPATAGPCWNGSALTAMFSAPTASLGCALTTMESDGSPMGVSNPRRERESLAESRDRCPELQKPASSIWLIAGCVTRFVCCWVTRWLAEDLLTLWETKQIAV